MKDGSLIAATSQISALFIPLDFIASRSRVIAVMDIFPFNQHQKAPGLNDSVGLANSFEISRNGLAASGIFFCSFGFEQLTVNRLNTIKCFMFMLFFFTILK
jgi:hypothetical protein